MATLQELLGRSATEIERARLVDQRRREEERLGRIATSSGVCERVAEARMQPSAFDSRRWTQAERDSEQTRGAIEGERAGRFIRRASRVFGRLIDIAGAGPVRRKRLRIGTARSLQGQREPTMVPPPRRWIEMDPHRVADPIVVGLDRIGATHAGGLDEVRRTQPPDLFDERPHRRPGRVRDRLLRQRTTRHRHQFEDRAIAFVEAGDARPQRLLEADEAGFLAEQQLAAHQLIDEQRVPARLARDRRRARHLRPALAHEEIDERACVIERQALDRQSTHLPGHPSRHVVHRARALATRRERARGTTLAPHRRDQQQRRRTRWPHHLGEQRQPVGVGPLQIVDQQHQRVAKGDRDEQLAQRRKQANAHPPRIE